MELKYKLNFDITGIPDLGNDERMSYIHRQSSLQIGTFKSEGFLYFVLK